jgi:hypothetical protein
MDNMPNIPPVLLLAPTKRQTSRAYRSVRAPIALLQRILADGFEDELDRQFACSLPRPRFKVHGPVVDQVIDAGGPLSKSRLCRTAETSSESELVGAIDYPRSKASIEFTFLAVTASRQR